MIEALFAVVMVVVEALIAMLAGLIELIAGLFVAGGEAVGAGEALLLLVLFSLEVIGWLLLCVFELLMALLLWRKPRKVAKPVIWRRKRAESPEKT
jgi:hypothetical protein